MNTKCPVCGHILNYGFPNCWKDAKICTAASCHPLYCEKVRIDQKKEEQMQTIKPRIVAV